MHLNLKRALTLAAVSCLALSMSVPAFALEYNFESDAPGRTFYQSTSTDQNYIADSGQIVVGMDGTVSSGVTGNVSSSPLSVLDLPVGEYPDAWGSATDVAIAQNSVYPNELGPTTQTVGIYIPTFTPTVDSGALPTGYNYLPAAVNGYGVYGVNSHTGYAVDANGNILHGAMGVATNVSPMPTITKGGAIARLQIPSIGLNKYVYEGTTQSNMSKGIAHFDSTSGWTGNIALAGHNRPVSWAAFAKLKDVKLGDTVTYTTAYGTATYVVSNITTCATTDTSGLLQDGTNKITMYTCKANQPEVKLCVVATLVGVNS